MDAFICIFDKPMPSAGFVDMHAHITGGGSEAGPASRCPESRISEFLAAGITAVVGVVGTDSITRSQVGGTA